MFLFCYVKHVRKSVVDVQRERETALRKDTNTSQSLQKARKAQATASTARTPASSDGVREETS